MKFGLMTKTFKEPSFAAVLDKMLSAGVRDVHLEFESAGLPKEYTELPKETVSSVSDELKKRGINLVSLSGTYNMIDPDLERRRRGFERLKLAIENARALGTDCVSMCTGTNSPDSMWKWHPDNASESSWRELSKEMERALDVAESCGVKLLVETEYSNVINGAKRARRLLDEQRSPYLRMIMDGANLFAPGEVKDMERVLNEAFELLADYIEIAHAKDIEDADELRFVAAGKGALDFPLFLRLLKQSGFDGAVIAHGLSADEVPASLKYLREIERAL